MRLICRDEIALIEQRTALVNGLRAALRELVKAGKRRWEKFLHAHRLWRPQTAEERLSLFAKAQSFAADQL